MESLVASTFFQFYFLWPLAVSVISPHYFYLKPLDSFLVLLNIMCLGWKFPSCRAWHKGSYDDMTRNTYDVFLGNTRNTSKRVGNSCKDRKAGWLELNPVGIHGVLQQNSCLRAIPLEGEACGGGCTSPPDCLLLEEGLTFLGTSSVLEWAEWPSDMQPSLHHSSKSALEHSERIEVQRM